MATISQRLTDEHGLCRVGVVGAAVDEREPDRTGRSVDRASPPRPPVEPGSEAQIDYGARGRGSTRPPARRQTLWAFVMVLACSRLMFVHPVLRLDQTSWCESHVLAFEYFQGCVARLVPDNLKTGVDRPDLYDPRINRAYAELATHYGVLPDPARVQTEGQARVERAMPYVRDSFWRGRTFISLPQMQQTAADLVRRRSPGVRKHRSLDGATPLLGVPRRRGAGVEPVAP